jgi:hypothetical protein
VEREGADHRRAQAAVVGVGDLDRLEQGGDGLGGPLDPPWSRPDRDADGHALADQGAARGLPHEAVVAGPLERVEPVLQADDPAEQGTGLQPFGPLGRVGPGVLR